MEAPTAANRLVHQRCFNHASREAAARCPRCRRFFCRECVTEHEGRVICARCLRELTADDPRRRRLLPALGAVAAAGLGMMALWVSLYCIGRMLLAIPSTFHQGFLWEGP